MNFFEMEAQLENNSIIQEASRINSIGLIQYYFEQSIQEIDNTIRYCNEFQLYDETTNYFSEALLSQNTKDKLKELARKIFGPLIKLLTYLYDKVKSLFDKDKQFEQEIKKSRTLRLNMKNLKGKRFTKSPGDKKFNKDELPDFEAESILHTPIPIPSKKITRESRKQVLNLIPMLDYNSLYNKLLEATKAITNFKSNDDLAHYIHDMKRSTSASLYYKIIGLDNEALKYNVSIPFYDGEDDFGYEHKISIKTLIYRIYCNDKNIDYERDIISNSCRDYITYIETDENHGNYYQRLVDQYYEVKKFALESIAQLKNYVAKLKGESNKHIETLYNSMSKSYDIKTSIDAWRSSPELMNAYVCKNIARYITMVILIIEECILEEYKYIKKALNNIKTLDDKYYKMNDYVKTNKISDRTDFNLSDE